MLFQSLGSRVHLVELARRDRLDSPVTRRASGVVRAVATAPPAEEASTRRISGIADKPVPFKGRSAGPRFTKPAEGVDCDQCELEWQPSDGWRALPHHPAKSELWEMIRAEAHEDAAAEPSLASFMHSSILGHSSLEKSIAFILANKLESRTLLSTQLMRLMLEAFEDDPSIMSAVVADILAVYERDPACDRYTQSLLFFKGFHAIQSHRIAHWLWYRSRKMLALAIQSRASEVLHVDIHPAASIGRGVMMDHATGCVIGETAVIGDNVSMLHDMTLGGSGNSKGIRHPTIGHGVLIGAGAAVLGAIDVGAGSKIGARSVVLESLPSHSVAVGVPARVVRTGQPFDPCTDMDQTRDFMLDFMI